MRTRVTHKEERTDRVGREGRHAARCSIPPPPPPRGSGLCSTELTTGECAGRDAALAGLAPSSSPLSLSSYPRGPAPPASRPRGVTNPPRIDFDLEDARCGSEALSAKSFSRAASASSSAPPSIIALSAATFASSALSALACALDARTSDSSCSTLAS
eukprot:31422-Pelagococcus_subviridis.AAC.1